jgi:hypothetical protein
MPGSASSGNLPFDVNVSNREDPESFGPEGYPMPYVIVVTVTDDQGFQERATIQLTQWIRGYDVESAWASLGGEEYQLELSRNGLIPDSCVYVLGMVKFENMTPDFGFGNFNNGEGYCLSFDPFTGEKSESPQIYSGPSGASDGDSWMDCRPPWYRSSPINPSSQLIWLAIPSVVTPKDSDGSILDKTDLHLRIYPSLSSIPRDQPEKEISALKISRSW